MDQGNEKQFAEDFFNSFFQHALMAGLDPLTALSEMRTRINEGFNEVLDSLPDDYFSNDKLWES